MINCVSAMREYAPPSNCLAGRVILVTGATGGLGRVAALSMASHGATVLLHGRDPAKLEALYDAIQASGAPEAALLPLDLRRAVMRDFDHLAHVISGQFGRLDGILHSAVHLEKLSPLADQTQDEWEHTLKVNLVAPMLLTRACLSLLRAAKDASIVYTLEQHACAPAPFWGQFAAAGAALVAAMRIQAQELDGAPRVNALIPGAVNSPLRNETHPGEDPQTRATPESLMNQYLYLMAADSVGVNGQVFHCQG